MVSQTKNIAREQNVCLSCYPLPCSISNLLISCCSCSPPSLHLIRSGWIRQIYLLFSFNHSCSFHRKERSFVQHGSSCREVRIRSKHRHQRSHRLGRRYVRDGVGSKRRSGLLLRVSTFPLGWEFDWENRREAGQCIIRRERDKLQ